MVLNDWGDFVADECSLTGGCAMSVMRTPEGELIAVEMPADDDGIFYIIPEGWLLVGPKQPYDGSESKVTC